MSSKGTSLFPILISVVLVAVVAGGAFTYQYWKPTVVKTWLQITSNDYILSGSFTGEERAAEEISLDDIAKTYSAEVTTLTSWPGQFQIYPLSSTSCQQVRNSLKSVKYIGRLGECQQKTTSPNPEKPAHKDR